MSRHDPEFGGKSEAGRGLVQRKTTGEQLDWGLAATSQRRVQHSRGLNRPNSPDRSKLMRGRVAWAGDFSLPRRGFCSRASLNRENTKCAAILQIFSILTLSRLCERLGRLKAARRACPRRPGRYLSTMLIALSAEPGCLRKATEVASVSSRNGGNCSRRSVLRDCGATLAD